jgi:hypothetical protein
MPFQREPETANLYWGPAYGEYLTTFKSEPTGQVRADLYRRGKRVDAHVSFERGVKPGNVTEKYVAELREYAREQGFADNFHLITASW